MEGPSSSGDGSSLVIEGASASLSDNGKSSDGPLFDGKSIEAPSSSSRDGKAFSAIEAASSLSSAGDGKSLNGPASSSDDKCLVIEGPSSLSSSADASSVLVSVVEHEDFVGGLYVPSVRPFTDLSGARSPAPSSALLLGEGWRWAASAWTRRAWTLSEAGRSRLWTRPKTPINSNSEPWVLVEAEEPQQTANSSNTPSSSTWTRLYTTFRTLSSSLLPLQNQQQQQQASLQEQQALWQRTVGRARAVLSLARVLARSVDLVASLELLESDDRAALGRAAAALRSAVSEQWLDEPRPREHAREARFVAKALQRLLSALDRDGEEYVAIVNALQPLLYILKEEEEDKPQQDEEDEEEEKLSEECRKFSVNDLNGQSEEFALFEDVLVRGLDVIPLEWLWIAYQKEKKMARLITLDGRVFAFSVQDNAVLDLLRGTVSRWLSKTGAVVEQNLRRVRCWSGDLVYRGTARAALFEGRGELATRDGLYTGQFHLGKRNGKGTQVGKGSSYRGQWLDDFYEGRGVLHYSREHDAFKFEGHFRRNLREGSGVLYRNDGSSLRCVWHDDAPCAPVLLTLPNGTVFVGGWQSNVCSGFGIEDTLSGRYYGEWSAGLRNGRGFFEAKGGTVYNGTWIAGQMSGKGTIETSTSCLSGNLQGDVFDLSISSARLVANPPLIPSGPHLFWNWLVKARLDPAVATITAAAAVSMSSVLQVPAVQQLLDEASVMVEALLGFSRTTGTSDGRRAPAQFLAALCAVLAPRLSASVTGENEDEPSLKLEREAARLLFGRARLYKRAQESVEQHRLDLALQQGYARFARQFEAEASGGVGAACSEALASLTSARSPWDKLLAAQRWLVALSSAASGAGLDELLPLAVQSVGVAAPPALATEQAFVEAFLSPRDVDALASSGSVSYAWTTFCSCVSYFQSLADESSTVNSSAAAATLVASSVNPILVQLEDPDLPSMNNRSFVRISPPSFSVPRVESADYMTEDKE